MRKILSLLLPLCICLLLCACGDETILKGTILERQGDQVVVDLTEGPVLEEVSFSLKENELDDFDLAAGDRIVLICEGEVHPSSSGTISPKGLGLAEESFHATLLSLDEEQAVVAPLPDEPLAQQAEEIAFPLTSLYGASLQREFSVGDEVSITYVRDLIPGDPPQLAVIDWGRSE